ncbi:MAG: SIMPL domain-containing protein [Patescibacteria group bacterium]|nr:SIMPL domain-containing protein [Patescibacteria group bacterium]
MDKILRNSIITSLFLFIVIFFWFVYKYPTSDKFSRTFTVTGEGKVEVVPNIAEIRIGLITQGSELSKIENENTQKINRIIKFLKEQGIEEKDIKTENYSVNPVYDYQKSPYQIVAYSINQNIVVKVRDLKKVGNILQRSVNYGANSVSGPNFIIDDQEIYLEKAREKAIKNAQEKAKKIAKIAGFRLGKIVNISESQQLPSPIPIFSQAGYGGERIMNKEEPTIQAGSQELKVQINIIYEIR